MRKCCSRPPIRRWPANSTRRWNSTRACISPLSPSTMRKRRTVGLPQSGFAVRDLVRMSRPVDTETGPATAAFTIARVEPGVMPEGRIQMLTHHTEQTVWQKRWLSHPNSAVGLIDVVIAVADVDEASARFARFTGRAATRTSGGAVLHLDRGGVYLVNYDRISERVPEVADNPAAVHGRLCIAGGIARRRRNRRRSCQSRLAYVRRWNNRGFSRRTRSGGVVLRRRRRRAALAALTPPPSIGHRRARSIQPEPSRPRRALLPSPRRASRCESDRR